jgi:hypothetical protein
MFQIQEKINAFSDISVSQRSELYQRFISRWSMLHTSLHAAGFLLDPEYLGMAQTTNEEVMTGFYQLVEQMFTDTNVQVLIANQLTQFQIKPWYIWKRNRQISCKNNAGISVVAEFWSKCT